jgi:integrase
MNPSCFRSQFAADLKAAGVPREVIASYMGHETPETMSKYGTWRQGKGGRRGYLVVDSQRQQESRRNTSGSRGSERRAFPRGG